MAYPSLEIFNHDVFLSIRREDNRRSFTDHLFSILGKKCLSFFKDEEEDLIENKFVGSIEESRYSFSSLCLDELMDCQVGVRKWREALTESADLSGWGQAEREFKVEVEAIGRLRHKNLGLLGFCVEGADMMLVYEYVDNGNLDQWLHGDVGDVSPLTWSIRMNIIQETAKGLAYLHAGLEPKFVHRDIKSSNILLDCEWNATVSDFGLAKLLGSDTSYVTTRVMGTFGYVEPLYVCTGMLTENSDVYSFGILIMELLTGRNPVDYGRPQGEVNLMEWLKKMAGNRKADEVGDPKLSEMPSSFYDVLLFFMGEDITRRIFIDDLYRALERKGISAYKDEEDLIENRGTIGDALTRSIEESRICIIIFSQNYASSSWCLDELVKIMECRNRIVYPVFYDVGPIDVCNQIGAVKDAERWRKALTEAANLSGWSYTKSGCDFILNVVLEIQNRLGRLKISVRTMSGKTVSVDVESSYTTIGNLKAKIQDMEGLPHYKQKLFFDGRQLDNHCTLADYKIENGYTLLLVPRLTGWIQIYVKTLTEKPISVEVRSSDTIGDVKVKITDMVGVTPYNQNFFFVGQELLDDDRTLDDYHILSESTLFLVPVRRGPMKIYVETVGETTIPLDVVSRNTIGEVKSLIQDKEGIPTCKQTLVYAGQKLDDSRTVVYYLIQNATTLRLVDNTLMRMEPIRIHVEIVATRKTILLQVNSFDTINSVKSKIQSQEDIPYEQQCLFLPQIQLKDDCTLADYYIQNRSTLYLAVTLITVAFKTPVRKSIILVVDSPDTILNVKTNILPCICQKLFLAEERERHQNSLTLYKCCVKTESALHLSVTPDKTCVDTISNVKAAIPPNNHLNA